jgi:thiol-disulfide isomerase/thioredoxin
MSDQKPAQDQPKSMNSGTKALVFAGVVAVALAAVLYGMSGQGGKETTSACAASSAAAQRIAPLAKGQLASLNVSKSPKPATEIAFDGPSGEKLKLSEFRGKTVLLNLWATWCVPCRVEMPALDRLQGELGGKNFEVVAVNIDTARLERRKAFLDSVGVNKLAFYTDPKADTFQVLKQAGKVIGLPTTILIDDKGCELGVMAGPAEWDGPEALALLRAAMQASSP